MVTIINYGLGNLGSIANMFKRIGTPCVVTSDAEIISKAEKILLPGVGAFDSAMRRITEIGLDYILKEKALKEKVPFMGICLGMQLLTNESEEGKLPGLGIINGKTVRFKFNDHSIKIPHMGWNKVSLTRPSPLITDVTSEQRFYFVHSYHVICDNPEDVLARTHYGYDFESIIQHENIMAGQFHPEKSHRFGMNLLANFANL